MLTPRWGEWTSRPLTSPHTSGGATCDDGAMERGTILVVDDEPNIADLVDLYLAPRGLPGPEGGDRRGRRSTRSRDHRPRLVVLDVGLPDIDGLEVCRASAADVADPGDLPHRARRRGRPRARPRARRRRLPHQAVLPRRARRTGEGRAAPGRRRRRRRGRAGRRRSPIDCGRREVRVDDEPGRVHHQGVRPAALPRRAPRARALAPADPRRRVGLRLVRRRAHRRRAHRAGAQEARRRGDDHDRARLSATASSRRRPRSLPPR